MHSGLLFAYIFPGDAFLGGWAMSDLAGILPKVLSVFAMAFIYFWASIPAGFALGLGPVIVAVTAWLSYTAGVALILVIGKPVVDWLMKRFGSKLNSNP